MTPGHRARVLAECYDPDMDAQEATGLTEAVMAVLREHFPRLTLVSYVEANPPADEVL